MLAGGHAYAKLSLSGAILNADLAGGTALSKLSVSATPDGTKFLRDGGSEATAGSTALGRQIHTIFMYLNHSRATQRA